MENLTDHWNNEPLLVVIMIVLLLLTIFLGYKIVQEYKQCGTWNYIPKWLSGLLLVCATIFVVCAVHNFSTFTSPPAKEIAIVIGNTQNTPKIDFSEGISEKIKDTMLQHKGSDIDELSESIVVISAVRNPKLIDLDYKNLKRIGNNNANAQNEVKNNLQAIENQVELLAPTENGANYLEAILEAVENVDSGASILVIGSGLSDSGDLNFADTNILTNELSRSEIINKIAKKYPSDILNGYSIIFYGLGDVAAPQEFLSVRQKSVVRDIYKDVIRKLGGRAVIDTSSRRGDSVATNYLVSTTDTGCGNKDWIFDNDKVKFIPDQPNYISPAEANVVLSQVKEFYEQYKDTIKDISITGFIAFADTTQLDLRRAEQVKSSLVTLGVPAGIISTQAGGVPDPAQIPDAQQRRMVKINVTRDGDMCDV